MSKLKYTFYIITLFFLISGCSSSSDSDDLNTPMDPNPVADETAPTIEVMGISDSIETFTDIVITINDESAVNSTIVINGIEEFSTTETNFTYTLNPYEIPVGDATVIIRSVDAAGNSGEESFNFTIQHLLMNYDFGMAESNLSNMRWFFFNDLDGNLLASNEIQVAENQNIYTETLISTDIVFYTTAEFIDVENGTSRFLSLRTYSIPLGSTREEFIPRSTFNRFNQVQIDINLESPDNGFTKYRAQGAEYFTRSIGGNGLDLARIIVDYDAPGQLYVRTDPSNGGVFFTGREEQYEYFSFMPDPSIPVVRLDELDFMSVTESIETSIFDHDPSTLWMNRYGYENEEDVAQGRDHKIYQVLENDNNSISDFVDLPIIPGLNIYRNRIQYRVDGNLFFKSKFGNTIDTSYPGWSFEFNETETDISVRGANEIEVYAIRLIKNQALNASTRLLSWRYDTFDARVAETTVPKLGLPAQISESIEDSFLNNLDGLQLFTATALDYDDFNSFEEFNAWQALNQIRPRGGQIDFSGIDISNPNFTFKSSDIPLSISFPPFSEND